jgi:hypothetical protein
VEPGYKQTYLISLSWLSEIHPIVYSFLNTDDGYKVLFKDHIFCEFAVFEPAELEKISDSPGRIIWKEDGVPDAFGQPVSTPGASTRRSIEFLLGEALTNLYVGLNRDKRGEKLTAMRFIQGYALDRLVELSEYVEIGNEVHRDPFVNARRFEQRYPTLIRDLSKWAQGYEKNRQSALAILEFLEEHFEVNKAMAAEIRSVYDGE